VAEVVLVLEEISPQQLERQILVAEAEAVGSHLTEPTVQVVLAVQA
jgi:histidine ammonia-lyase